MGWFFKVIDAVHNLTQICENIDGTTVIIAFRKLPGETCKTFLDFEGVLSSKLLDQLRGQD